MRRNDLEWIGECSIHQNIKFQWLPEWEDEVEHHLNSLSVDTLGPLKEDENGNSFVIVIADNFSKLVGLYPAKSTTSKEYFFYNGYQFLVFRKRSEAMEGRSLRPTWQRTFVYYSTTTI